MGSKRIKLVNASPGMVIKGDFHYGLIVYNKKPGKVDLFHGVNPGIEMFDAECPESGRMHSSYDPEEKVTVLTGKKRDDVLKMILRAQRSRALDAERDRKVVETLIQLTS